MNTLFQYLDRELSAINAYISSQIDALDGLISPVAGHVLMAGGKRFRPLLTILCARALGHPRADIYPLACSLEFLHSATLLHDDILDGAALRRGKTAAHLVFSRTETVLAGDVLLALANLRVAEYGDPRLTACLSEAVMRTAAGEVAEIANLRVQDTSRDKYISIITGKTAYLMEAACRSGALLSDVDETLVQAAATYGLNLGIAFQVVDDAMDYTSPSDVSGKPAGGDLREGKLTLPLLYYLDGLDEKARIELLAKMQSRSFSDAETQTLVADIQRLGLPQRARQEAAVFVDRGRKALESFPASEERSALAEALDFVLSRQR